MNKNMAWKGLTLWFCDPVFLQEVAQQLKILKELKEPDKKEDYKEIFPE